MHTAFIIIILFFFHNEGFMFYFTVKLSEKGYYEKMKLSFIKIGNDWEDLLSILKIAPCTSTVNFFSCSGLSDEE